MRSLCASKAVYVMLHCETQTFPGHSETGEEVVVVSVVILVVVIGIHLFATLVNIDWRDGMVGGLV